MEQQEKLEKSYQMGKILLIPSLIYALIYTFCLYDNLSGITVIVFAITTILYVRYVMKQLQIERKKNTSFYERVFLLLGISSATTGNGSIIALNTVGMVGVLLAMLLHNFFEDRNWKPNQYILSMIYSVFGALLMINVPFEDGYRCYGSKKKDNKSNVTNNLFYVLIGICVTVPVLAIIVGLLFTADAVFADVLRKMFSFQLQVNMEAIVKVIVLFLFAFLSAYCGIRFLEQRKMYIIKEAKRWSPYIAITSLSMIAVVYILFCGIQLTYLFFGNMSLPKGYTYAMYAREGFFQLLVVCLINVAIVLFVQNHFEQSKLVKALLLFVSGCTYIMVISSAYRMMMYIKEYHLTFLRVSVLWALGVIALLLVGIIVKIVRGTFAWTRYSMVVICVSYLVLSFSHIDYFIASYNLAHAKVSAEMTIEDGDDTYLEFLSSDAAPVIVRYNGPWVDSYAKRIETTTPKGVRHFNVSRTYAKYVLGIK